MGLYLASEEGQGLVEYALIIVFIGIVVIAIVSLTGERIYHMYDYVRSRLPF